MKEVWQVNFVSGKREYTFHVFTDAKKAQKFADKCNEELIDMKVHTSNFIEERCLNTKWKYIQIHPEGAYVEACPEPIPVD